MSTSTESLRRAQTLIPEIHHGNSPSHLTFCTLHPKRVRYLTHWERALNRPENSHLGHTTLHSSVISHTGHTLTQLRHLKTWTDPKPAQRNDILLPTTKSHPTQDTCQ